MKTKIKRVISWLLLCAMFVWEGSLAGYAAPEETMGPEIGAPSALLMEASTGTVIYEKNADEPRNPASVTKIMTLILIFDALQSGKISLSDEVVTSAHAKSMGGSQVFLEEGEVQTVETLIKCIVIASGNDASVAMAEYIGGDEGSFVQMMNERAAGLGMTHTKFIDCCGLTDSPEHVTTARDIALMSRELITKYPQITNYSTIWMENITHVTKQGTKEFGLSNTNKLLKMATNFEVTGLKTGSTSIAKYCLSATAKKDGIELIAAIMAAPDYKTRFNDAVTLLNYGYANCRVYRDESMPQLADVPVRNGIGETVPAQYRDSFSFLSLHGEDFGAIEKELMLEETVEAPVKRGDVLGYLVYKLDGEELGRVTIIAAEDMEAAAFLDYMRKVWEAALF
ncbi:MAG: D-alanyl-D-alanine carboxypeptidase [Lachnospiraceae bacterium]|jgi:D-alanyl-D-alanine carboxypeptidase (penicillin-binding protein 5/6)|nr:D-alanyl-D-alanine carboxypeptidase [Lachnospiraceae bacterium]NBJ80693.1 D-alanyl-D-alanine carboxypeptidase [bacterium 1XD42-76]NBK03902.1 D-alanyl-D-alanine carboxypeptidase [bacterium 1XD42-94]